MKEAAIFDEHACVRLVTTFSVCRESAEEVNEALCKLLTELLHACVQHMVDDCWNFSLDAAE